MGIYQPGPRGQREADGCYAVVFLNNIILRIGMYQVPNI